MILVALFNPGHFMILCLLIPQHSLFCKANTTNHLCGEVINQVGRKLKQQKQGHSPKLGACSANSPCELMPTQGREQKSMSRSVSSQQVSDKLSLCFCSQDLCTSML